MSLGVLVIRLVVGLLLAGHGAQKLFGWFGGNGLSGTGELFESIGLHHGRWMALTAGLAEVLGGTLFVLGLLTPLGAALLSAVMFTAIWTVHRSRGIWVTDGGPEYNIVLLAAAFGVTAIGAGTASLDHAFGVDAAGPAWAFGELAAGALGAATTLAFARLSMRRRFRSMEPAGRY
jgi:putative oxidoreductase